MNDLKKYEPGQLQAELEAWDETETGAAASDNSMLRALSRRWWIVVLTFVLICVAGIPPVWILIEPKFDYVGAIRVAPILMNPLSGERDPGEISNYQMFVNTQAKLIKSSPVLQRVASNLADKNLPFFAESTSPVQTLRQAIVDEQIKVATAHRTELIEIRMRDRKGDQGEIIVDAFIRAYMAIEGSRSAEGGDRNLALLEDERRTLATRLKSQRSMIRRMAEEYGTDALTGRQNMMLEQVTYLQSELTRTYTKRISLETRLELLKNKKEIHISPEQLADRRQKYINADITVAELNRIVMQLEQQMVKARQTLAPTNPELKRKKELLETFKENLQSRCETVGLRFDKLIEEEISQSSERDLAKKQAELAQAVAYENRIQAMLDSQNTETIELGRKQLAIQDLQEEWNTTKEFYETIRSRIRDLEMERKRPARITVAYYADAVPVISKRLKYTVAIILGALACGIFLGFVRDKFDHSLHTPEDVVRCVGVPIIGTTTSSDHLDKKLLPQYVADDYQTIRANLGLFSTEGIPQKLVVTSAGMREGKTTFAVNLAISMARAGSKVLLIDGDFRKPDVGRLLNLNQNHGGLQQVLLGMKTIEQAVCSTSMARLDVLTADTRDISNTFELLVQAQMGGFLENIGDKYDHVVIDTPPVLAAADALLWAKMADAVVLTSFAGGTVGAEMKAAMERLNRINARVLGAVLHSVPARDSYHRYGYGYYSREGQTKVSRRGERPLLLSPEQINDNGDNEES